MSQRDYEVFRPFRAWSRRPATGIADRKRAPAGFSRSPEAGLSVRRFIGQDTRLKIEPVMQASGRALGWVSALGRRPKHLLSEVPGGADWCMTV